MSQEDSGAEAHGTIGGGANFRKWAEMKEVGGWNMPLEGVFSPKPLCPSPFLLLTVTGK